MDGHTNPRMVQFHLKVSKCDQFVAGSNIVVGRTGSAVCPVTAILRYIEVRGDVPGPFLWTLSAEVYASTIKFISQVELF